MKASNAWPSSESSGSTTATRKGSMAPISSSGPNIIMNTVDITSGNSSDHIMMSTLRTSPSSV